MSYFGTTDFGLEVAVGNVAGYAKVNKFGETTNADSAVPTDIWDGAISIPIWVPPTAARVHAIVSSSANDAAAGTGMRTVKIYGLKTWSTAETNETVIMNGVASVNTVESYVIIHRMEAITWGTGGLNAGNISATAAVDATVTAAIRVGFNQSQMMIYGIPDTQSLQIKRFISEIVKGTGVSRRADCEVLMMSDPATNVADNTAWTNKENFLLTEGQNAWTHEYPVPKSCDGPCIVKIQATSNSNNTRVIAGMDAYVVDN